MTEKIFGAIKVIKQHWMLVLGGLFIVSMAIALAMTLTTRTPEEEPTVIEAVGRNNISFNVFYIENDLFPENPVPANLHFMRLFTDFVEIRSSFSANFGEELTINYSYVANTRFVISHSTGLVGGTSVVFEEAEEISRLSDSTFASVLNFQPVNDGAPGGLYTINLREYLETFNNFISYFDRQMEVMGVTAGSRNFSAEIFVEFTYSVNAPTIGLNESSTRGFRIPISTEVFTLEAIGSTGFNTQRTIGASIVETLNTASIFAYVTIIFVGAGFVLLHFCKSTKPNKSKALAASIIKKYSSEIIFSQNEIDLSGYQIVQLDDFDELLKLSINLGKHITCHNNDEKAQFCSIVDNFAYCYSIDFEKSEEEVLAE